MFFVAALAGLGFSPHQCFLEGLERPAVVTAEAVVGHPIFREGEEVVTHTLSGPRRNGRRGIVLCWLPDQQRYRVRMTADKVLVLAHHQLVAAPKAKATATMAPFRRSMREAAP